MLRRFVLYGALGFATETAFTIAARRPKLPHPATLAVYGLAAPLLPPLADRLHGSALPLRACAYAVGIAAVEYLAGCVLRRAFGAAPWDYSHARWNVDGLTRLDYLPLWALYGLFLERVDEFA